MSVENLPAHTEVWTDGSAKHGIGGWGWVTPDGRSASGGEARPSTNQRMEIAAALAAVTTITDRPLLIVSDSAYVVNCLAGETEIVTRDGIKRIGDLAGQRVSVRDGRNAWVETLVRSYGVQPLRRVTFRSRKQEKVVYATGGHRWRVARSKRAAQETAWVTTDTLRVGDNTIKRSGRKGTPANISPVGVQSGFIFGDGASTRHGARAVLCGDKDLDLLDYFSGVKFTEQKNGVRTSGYVFPRDWKVSTPGLDAGPSFLMGWLAGYFAADGCVTTGGSAMIHSAKLENIEFVRSLCASVLHVRTGPIRMQMRQGYGTQKTPLYALTLEPSDLPIDFFVISRHRDRVTAARESRPQVSRWTVASVEETDRVEEVFCVEVPTTDSFLLADGLLTGNCFNKGWWKSWVRNDAWTNSKGEPVANRDLWEPLVAEVRRGGIAFRWVKGHAGHVLNEQADRLAEQGRIAMGGTPNLGIDRPARPRRRRRSAR